MSLSLETLGVLILTLIGVGVLTGVLLSIDNEENIDPVEASVKGSDYPVCQEFEQGEGLDQEDFKILLYGRYYEVCESENNTVEMDFILEKQWLEKQIEQMSEEPELIYREECGPIPGFNGFVVEESADERIAGFGDSLVFNGTGSVGVCKE